ncbi:aquaporin-like protein [Glomus cerebriforme]|uniref:Aquaporin-like protein n=1 Tax=Glomus cerebriforme TaxID=658196 RepID=A0A397SDV8_9GLOM|nr:aquaporin-like protein [Glomus cerebriforme]
MSFKTSKHDITASIGEFLGTAYFLFMGVGGAVSFANNASPAISVLGVPFCFGFSLFVNVFIWAPVSGGVFNPAITIGLMVTKNIALVRGVMYIVAQLLGALVGSWLIDLVQFNVPGGATVLSDGVTTSQALFLEMFTTSVLTMAVLMLAVEKHGNFMAPFGIGMALFISALCAGPYTGASLNPARTFGPSIVTNQFGRSHWIYYVGPILGSLLASAYWYLLKFLQYEKAVGSAPEKADSDRNVEKADSDV